MLNSVKEWRSQGIGFAIARVRDEVRERMWLAGIEAVVARRTSTTGDRLVAALGRVRGQKLSGRWTGAVRPGPPRGALSLRSARAKRPSHGHDEASAIARNDAPRRLPRRSPELEGEAA